MPTQMPMTGRPPASRRPTIQSPRASFRPRHAGGEGADAGDQEPVGVHGLVVVAGDLDVGADAREGPLGGADVAEAVVEDDDLLRCRRAQSQTLQPQDAGARHITDADRRAGRCRLLGMLLLGEGVDAAGQEEPDDDQDGGEAGHGYRAPFVEGRMPAARGSRSMAYRRARARALNWHSTMWWALRPYGHVDVQGDLGLGDEGLQDVPGHRRVVLADHRRHVLGLGVHEVRAAGEVDGTWARDSSSGTCSCRSGRCPPCRRGPA